MTVYETAASLPWPKGSLERMAPDSEVEVFSRVVCDAICGLIPIRDGNHGLALRSFEFQDEWLSGYFSRNNDQNATGTDIVHMGTLAGEAAVIDLYASEVLEVAVEPWYLKPQQALHLIIIKAELEVNPVVLTFDSTGQSYFDRLVTYVNTNMLERIRQARKPAGKDLP